MHRGVLWAALQRSSHIPLFSIILPTYGVESYIAQALTCLRNQIYSDFEVLVVDDASPDQSVAIAQRFADQDERIRIIHHTDNQGLSAARNSGISFAKGRYITFFDPDDTYEPQLLEKVAESLDRQRAQIILFGHTEDTCNEAGEITQSLAYPVPISSSKECLLRSPLWVLLRYLPQHLQHMNTNRQKPFILWC